MRRLALGTMAAPLLVLAPSAVAYAATNDGPDGSGETHADMNFKYLDAGFLRR